LTLPIGPRIIAFIQSHLGPGNLSLAINLLIFCTGAGVLLVTLIRFKIREPIRYLWLIAIFMAAFDIIQIPGGPAERFHFLEYAIVSILWWRVIRYYSTRKLQIFFSTFLITTCFGCLDELIQFFLPNRFFGYDDMIRNASGGALGMIYLSLVGRRRTGG